MMITSNHVVGDKDIEPGKKLVLSLNNEKVYNEILIDGKRKMYTNKEYNITMIEIKKKDNVDESSFMEIDDNIFKDDQIILDKKSVYLLSYPQGREANHSQGEIKSLKDDGYTIEYLCDTNSGCIGAPIINIKNSKVIGIHVGTQKNKKYNIGTFFKNPIEEFNKNV